MSDILRTYTGEQARNLLSAFYILKEKDLLDSDEKKIATRLQLKLSNAAQKASGGYTEIPISKDEEELLTHVEGSLWK